MQNTKICYRFFRTGFLFSDRRQYYGAWLGGMGETQLISMGGRVSSHGLGSVVGIATAYGLDGPGIESR